MKVALLSKVFLVFLALPLATQQFSFGESSDEQADADGGDRQIAKRRTVTPKKFKFHKVERVYVDDFVEDETDNDNADKSNKNRDDGKGNGNGNGNNEEDNDNAERAADDELDAASSRTNEDEEFQFERAHRAQKKRSRQRTKTTAAQASKEHAAGARDENDEESTFLGQIFGKLFGGEAKTEEQSSSNSIIDWLQWLGEHTGRLKTPEPAPLPPARPKAASESVSWFSYLNRWPFNSIFPIGQPAKPTGAPRHGKERSRDAALDEATSKEQRRASDAISQEHFERLLHSLPGFVANASYVESLECRQQLQIFHRQLRAHKLWTLQMFDATGKITSGILRGNINQLGDFDLCTQLRTVVKVTPQIPIRIRGKYCLAHIETQTDTAALKVPVHLAHGRGLWNGHLGNPGHFVPRYSVAHWGVCVPNACSAADVRSLLETNFRPYNGTGIEFHIEVDDDDCVTRQSRNWLRLVKKDSKFAAAILSIMGLVLIGFVELLWEHWPWIYGLLQKLNRHTSNIPEEPKVEPTESNEEPEATDVGTSPATEPAKAEPETEDEPEIEAGAATQSDAESSSGEPAANVNTSIKLLALEIFRSFSPARTVRRLLQQDHVDMEFPSIHVIRLGATFMLYISLKYLMIGHLPISNRDSLVNALEQPWSILFRSPTLYNDMLLVVSGFLAAYQLAEEMEQKSRIQLLKRITMKVIRHLPSVYLVLCFQTWVLPQLGDGPLWNKLVGEHARLCEQQMWRNVFSVQNAIDMEETCSPMTTHLAVDVQLYLLGPLIVWLYYTDSDASFFAFGVLQAISVAMRYARTNREHLSLVLFHGMNVSKFYRTANLIYASPISRASCYLLGIGAGLRYRAEQDGLQVSSRLLPIGWLLATLSIAWYYWSSAAGLRTDYIYTPSTAAEYAAWSPLISGLAICWCILMFPRSEKSLIRFMSSSRPVILLSRISFPMQLVMYVIVIWNTATVKETLKYHASELVDFREIGLIVCIGALLAMIIDVPAQQICHLLVNRIFVEAAPVQEDEPGATSGDEPSEEANPVNSNTPEPADAVWASDAEEEEQKYLARRRSSVLSGVDETEKVTASPTAAQESAALKVDKEEVEEVEEEEEEDEVETEIEETVKKPPPEQKKEPTPPPPPAPTPAPATTRRRRPVSDA